MLMPLRWLDHTRPTVSQDLALDEALLEQAEAEGGPGTLRLWSPPRHAVVLGASGKLADEVDPEACRREDIPIYRRSSGGGTVIVGPGALNVAVVLPVDADPALSGVETAQAFVLGRFAETIRRLGPRVEVRGSGDLVLGDRKVAGSAQRRMRRHVLIHATILCDFPLDLIARCLRQPARQPAYRGGRGHGEFVANLGVDRMGLTEALRRAWDADDGAAIPGALVARLDAEKFADPAWVGRF